MRAQDAPDFDAVGFDAGPDPELTTCLEIEDETLIGGARVWPGDATTAGGVLILDADNGGRATIRFSLDTEREVSLWARVRAPSHSNNSLFMALGEFAAEPTDEARWDIPVTPVLSWQRIAPRGDGEEWRPADPNWPGMLAAGEHALVFAGREASVELDAFCVTTADARPSPRHVAPPAHDDVVNAADFGVTGDDESDDTSALQEALDSLTEGQTLRLPPGRVTTTDFVRITTSDVTLEGTMEGDERATTLYFNQQPRETNGSTSGILVVGDGHGDSTPLLEDAGDLGRTIVVDEGSEFDVGDFVVVDSDAHVAENTDVGLPHFRFLHTHARVMERSVDGGRAILTLDRPILESFARDNNARVSSFNPMRGIVIRNMILEGTQNQLGEDDSVWTRVERALNADIQFIRMRRVANSYIHNLEIRHFRKQAVLLNDTLGVHIFDNFIHDSTDFGGNGQGYGLATEFSQGVDVYNNTLRGVMRHSLSFSVGTHESRMIDNDMVRGVDADEPGPDHLWACIDIHGEHSYGILIARNHTVNGEYGVILGGGFESHGNDGNWIVIRDNLLEGAFGGGAGSNDHTYNAIIENNTLNNNRRGVHLFINNDNTFVWNNTIDGSREHGLFVEDSNGTQFIGNTITNSGGADIRFDDTCGGYEVRENEYTGIEHPGAGTVE